MNKGYIVDRNTMNNAQALKQAIDRNDERKAMAILQQNESMLNKYCVLTFLPFPPYLIICFNLVVSDCTPFHL